MSNKLYICNIPYIVSSKDLEDLFSSCGTVTYATVIKDRDTGNSKGFGFVEMENEDQKIKAIETMNNRKIGNRSIKVRESIDRDDYVHNRAIRPKAQILNKGTCILCGIENTLAGYPGSNGKGICGACSKIMSSVHYHDQKLKKNHGIPEEVVMECLRRR